MRRSPSNHRKLSISFPPSGEKKTHRRSRSETEPNLIYHSERPKLENSSKTPRKKFIKLKIHHLEILDQIGCGASGTQVYSVMIDGMKCAMKEVELDCENKEALESLVSEINILESLERHPNVCRYIYHEVKDYKLRLFSSLYSCSLEKVIDKTLEPFEWHIVLRAVRDIAQGILFLHQNKIIHRDIKPNNILVQEKVGEPIGILSIADFDTAKIKKDKELTIVGTPLFIAPEMLSHQSYSYPVDVYSFGMVIYILLALKYPYYHVDYFEAIKLKEKGIPPIFPPYKYQFTQLISLHRRCISFDPEKRPTMRTICRELVNLEHLI